VLLYASVAILAGKKDETLTSGISSAFSNTLALTPRSLLVEGESFQVIIDSGCTRTATGIESDFVPDSIVDLEHAGKAFVIDSVFTRTILSLSGKMVRRSVLIMMFNQDYLTFAHIVTPCPLPIYAPCRDV
jgi:hypothetical protein